MTNPHSDPASGHQPIRAVDGADIVELPAPSRRTAFRAIIGGATILSLPAKARAADPDRLLRWLGEELERIYREWIAVSVSYLPEQEVLLDQWRANYRPGIDPNCDKLYSMTAHLKPLADAAEAIDVRVRQLARRITDTPASTFAGLAVKARAIEIENHGWPLGMDNGGVREIIDRREIDYDIEQLLILTDEIRRLAAIEAGEAAAGGAS